METKNIIIVLMAKTVRLIANNVGINSIQIAFVHMADARMLVPSVVVLHFVLMDREEQGVGNVVRRRIYVSMDGFVSNV
jgi:hypothetical protein